MNILIDGQTFATPEIHRGIGIYFKNVINAMLKIDYIHSWYVCVSDTGQMKELDAWVQRKIHVVVSPEFEPGSDYKRNAVYTEKIKDVIKAYQIDAFWIPNALMVNVLFLNQQLPCKVFAVIYDIIPYVLPVREWPKTVRNEYLRRLQYLKENKVQLLFISQFSAKDYMENINPVPSINVALPAADHYRFYQKWEKQKIQESPYILFTGGFDYRKNIDGAIDAYHAAVSMHKEDEEFQKYRLVIVGSYDAKQKLHYENILKQKGISDKVELTGYVSDEKLADLYKNAEVFFFPSKYEGFGLPVLEAMLAGNYIVCADNSSLPEVCGGHALLCDAEDVTSMAQALYQAYCNRKKESGQEVRLRQEYARSFTWEKTARKTLDVLEHACRKGKTDGERKKIAVFTPWPEQKTGIANYMYKLTPYLAEYFDIDIYTDAVSKSRSIAPNISVFDRKAYPKQKGQYQHVLYEIGNNVEYHKAIYEAFETEPDIAEIHDYVLTSFFYESFFRKGKKKKFQELLEAAYGEEGTRQYQLCTEGVSPPDVMKYPMSVLLVKRAGRVIVHNHWTKTQLGSANVAIIPHACFDKEVLAPKDIEKIRSLIREKIGLTDELLIGCFGWVNSNKRFPVIIDAVKSLLYQNYKIKLVFWGESNTDEVFLKIQKEHLEQSICVTGYLDKAEYEAALEITDLVVNLRYPSMGESSGTLCEAFKYGKAVIVSEWNQYDEYPDEVCWKLPVCRQETELLSSYIKYLADNPKVREALGRNAKRYADDVLHPKKIAGYYAECFHHSF